MRAGILKAMVLQRSTCHGFLFCHTKMVGGSRGPGNCVLEFQATTTRSPRIEVLEYSRDLQLFIYHAHNDDMNKAWQRIIG